MLHRPMTPPMGWNSYDNYDTTVTEEEVLRSAAVVRDRLKPFGWEYVVVDIQWYAADTGTQRDRWQYIPFGKVFMDEYSRLIPCEDKFPSAAGGKGFAPLAEKIHAMGLKFGIHIMRGVPRIAAHLHLPLEGTSVTADQIADPASICRWNPDMYGVRDTEAGQAYYDSLIRLYAGWGVDFIKCDDICNTNMYPDGWRGAAEIAMLHRAIDRVDRPIVLSLSPGPALPDKAAWYAEHATMWRITDDLWDVWPLLKDMFHRCDTWQHQLTPGTWPDCDMLPLGHIAERFGNGHECGLTPDEQQTMMTLWCIFRSPLMLGADVTRLDAATERLLTNRAVLALNAADRLPRLVRCTEDEAVWRSDAPGKPTAAALFNLSDEERVVTFEADGPFSAARDLWTGERLPGGRSLSARLRPHACLLAELEG